ncbi:MAG: mucoidy inhibitor MuiA family protein, partial [Isosphaeraceae bacterium]
MHVTLYRGQAMVTRTIPIEGAKGSKELVVGDLPEQVVADSLFAEGGGGIEVRAVQFRSRAVGEEPRNEVRKVDEGIEQVNDKLLENTKAQERLTKQTTFLDQLDGFVAASAKSDLAWGVLDAAALEKVTLFSFGQRDKLAGASVTLAKEAKELNNHLSLLQRRRGELTSGALRTVREALLFVDKRGEGQGSVRLSYLVGQCEWSPAYTFRAGGDRKQIRVECNGLIQQMSGEDWGDVQLMLSTASPSLSASGPGLAAFSVTLNKEAAPKPLNPEELTARLDAVRERLRAAVALHRGAQSPAEKAKLDWVLNAAANEFQGLELM